MSTAGWTRKEQMTLALCGLVAVLVLVLVRITPLRALAAAPPPPPDGTFLFAPHTRLSGPGREMVGITVHGRTATLIVQQKGCAAERLSARLFKP